MSGESHIDFSRSHSGHQPREELIENVDVMPPSDQLKVILIRTVQGLLLLILLLFCVCTYRAFFTFTKPKIHLEQRPSPQFDVPRCLERFSKALTYQTVSRDDGYINEDALRNFASFIENNFPLIHTRDFIQRETIANHSKLYTFRGTNLKLKPYMLAAHLDVVPVERENWNMDPFSGSRVGGYTYGRGAIDTKATLMALLEVLEFLLDTGFKPKRTIILAFGHDEEVGGSNGAANIAKVLRERNTALEYILDEGTTVSIGIVPGVVVPVAHIGVAEKNQVVVKLEAKTISPNNAIMELVKATSRFHSWIQPSRFSQGFGKETLEHLAPYASLPYRYIFSNFWLFGSLFSYIASKKKETNAVLRTTTAVTIIDSRLDDNEDVPTYAYAIVDHRVHPFQTVEEVLTLDRELIKDTNVSIHLKSYTPTKPVSNYGDSVFGYISIKKALYNVVPQAAITPTLLFGATDTRWYLDFTKNVYRFSPLVLKKEDIETVHGNNERLSDENYNRLLKFYYHLVLNSDSSK